MPRVPGLFFLGFLFAASARGEARLEVSGAVQVVDDMLQVRLDLTNKGDLLARAVAVEAELLGHRASGRVETGVPPGATRSLPLRFPAGVPRPGVHPVALRLDYESVPTPGPVSQRAYLLLSLGANPPPAVRVKAPEVTVRDRDLLRAELESADGAPHRVRLRVLTPRGLNAESPEGEVEVPATGSAVVEVPVLRGGAPRPSRQGLLLLAGTTDGPYETTAVGTTVVSVAPDPALMPHLRRPFALAALALLIAAVVVELLGLRRRGPAR